MKPGGAGAERFSDTTKLTITETADERPGADVDDGFATIGSELAVYASGSIRPAQGQLQSLLVKLSITGSHCAVPGQKPNSRSLHVKAAHHRRNNSHAFRTVPDA